MVITHIAQAPDVDVAYGIKDQGQAIGAAITAAGGFVAGLAVAVTVMALLVETATGLWAALLGAHTVGVGGMMIGAGLAIMNEGFDIMEEAKKQREKNRCK